MPEPRKTGHRLVDSLAYVQGFLEPMEKAAFEAHLATCDECQGTVAFARVFVPALGQAVLEQSKPTDAQLLAKVRQLQAERRAAPSLGALLARYWWALALALLLAVVGAVLGGRSPSAPPSRDIMNAPIAPPDRPRSTIPPDWQDPEDLPASVSDGGR